MMEDYKKKAYKKYISTRLGDEYSGIDKEFELYYRYFKKNYSRFLPSDKRSRILDIGCGMGHFLYFLQQEGYENAIGIDLSEENVNFCKAKGINIIKADAFEFLKKNNEYFECIVMNDVLEHFKKEEIIEILTLIKNNLHREGTFICKTINSSNPLTGSIGRYIDFTHEVGFTEDSLNQVLKIAKFKQVEIYPQDIYILKNPIINLLAKTAAFILYKVFYVLFLLHGIKTTHIFTKMIIGVARK